MNYSLKETKPDFHQVFKIRSVKATKPTVPPPEPFFKTTVGIITIVAGCVAVILAVVAVVIWRMRAKKR